MKPPTNPPKQFRRASTLFCACLLVVLLTARAPHYSEAQTIQKVAVKKDAPSASASKPSDSETKAPKAEADSPEKKEDSGDGKIEKKKIDADKKDAADGVETKKEVAASDPPAKGKDKDAKKGDDKDKDGKKGEEKLNSTDEIQLSFQGAQIDMVVQWLAQQTGKNVIKHPRVQCQLTIVGSKKIQRREAINLVYHALSLEGFTAIESSKAILIVPEGQEPKMSPELLGGTKNDVPEGRQKLVKIFPLSHAQATELKEKVKPLLSDKGAIDTDDRANQIIVTDYTENIALIGDMIRALDSDRPQDVAVRVIPLKNVSAQDLVKEIGPLYQKLTSKSPTKETVEVSANDRSNSLMILSSEANFKALEAVIASLDTEDAQEKVMRAFPLKNAEAQDVAKQLQDLYQDQDNNNRYPYYYYFGSSNQQRGQSKKLNVVADRRRNTLIVQAPPSAMDNIQKMIEALDEPVGDESLAPRIYALKYVSAPDIEDILNELFLKKMPTRNYWDPWSGMPEPSNVDRDVGRLYGKVRITSDPYSNSLIIAANSKENLEAVEEILKQLDQPSQAGETTLRVGLNFAKAATVANSINILFAKAGSPPLRGGPQQQQQNNPQPQQQQQQQQAGSYEANFTLDQETKEEGYYPWLNGQPDNQRTADGRTVNRQVSDLVGKVRVVPDQRSNSLLISANVHFFPQIMKLIEDLDAPTPQVLIEAKILEVSSDFLDKLGVRWSPDGTKVFTADDFDNSVLLNTKGAFAKGLGGAQVFGGPAGTAAATAIANGVHSGFLSGTMNLDFLVQFLRRTTDASVLAEPQINIEDNQTGRIFVGQEVPTLDNSITTQVGGLTQGFRYKDVGVILEVTPHINASGDVSLKIHAESSAVVPGVTAFNGANFFDTRNFKTDLEAKDGQTLVLGGIIQRQISDTVRKTPILGDIPGLGWAFKKKDKETKEVELMVFLTPKVVRTPEQAKEMLREIEKKAPLIKQWENDYHKSRDLKIQEDKNKDESSKGKEEKVD